MAKRKTAATKPKLTELKASPAENTNGDIPVVEGISIEDAEKVLELQQQQRIKECRALVAAAMEKTNCRLEPEVIIRASGTLSHFNIIAL